MPHNSNIRSRLGLRPVVNVAGTMTSLGASIICPEAIEAMCEIATEWVEMDDLQRKASMVIAKATGAEAGFVTSCCAAAITLAVAATITGTDLLAVETLPEVAPGKRVQVLLQSGHAIGYGAPIEQAIRLAGGRPILLGTVSSTMDYHLANAIGPETAAVLHVVTHHSSQFGMLSLDEVLEICKPLGVPVIVDAASEYDLSGFIAKGADLALYSGHKFLAGPTSGIIAGRLDLVRAAFLNNHGVGRGMKAGKESIAGAMAALEAWGRRDHAKARRSERAALDLWLEALQGQDGISTRLLPDATGNPVDRVEVFVAPESGYTAVGLVETLAANDPPIIVRGHEAELGHFQLDPCNLHPGEAELVAQALRQAFSGGRPANARAEARHSASQMLLWPS